MTRTIIETADGLVCYLGLIRVAVAADAATARMVLDHVERIAAAQVAAGIDLGAAIRATVAARAGDDIRQRIASVLTGGEQG